MAYLDWSTVRTNLDAAIVALSSVISPAYIVGTARLQELDAVGAAYESDYARLSAEATADEAAYTTAVSDWTTTITGPWNRLDRACRYLEGRQYGAQLGRRVVPRRITNTYGAKVILSGDTYALPLSGGVVTDEVLHDTAARGEITLATGGSAPILRVRSLVDGYAGRFVTATVANASDGVATHFKLTLARGVSPNQYAEVYDNLDASSAPPRLGSQTDSLLALPFEQVGLGRPVNSGPTALSGGTGGLYEAATDRASRLRALLGADDDVAVFTAEDVAVLDEASAQFEVAWGQRPTLRNVLEQREAALQAAMDAAVNITEYLTSGLA